MSSTKSLVRVTPKRPCRHCGKDDWCYYFSNSGLEVCNRDQIATGWKASGKSDENGQPYLYKEEAPKSKPKIVSTQRYYYPDRQGEPLARVTVIRYEDAPKRVFRQGRKNGKWVNSSSHIDRHEIPIYKYAEIREAIKDGLQIFFVEGEKCADILWSLGIPATTNFGGSNALQDSDLEDLKGANLVICPDCDEPGIKLAEKVREAFLDSQWLYAFPEHRSWSKETLPKSDGSDVYDWVTEKKLSAENIYDAIEPYRGDFRPNDKPLMAPEAEQHYTEKAIDALYSDGHYIAIEEDLYKFNGKYYEKILFKNERRRIADWGRSTPVPVGVDRWKHSHANPASVNNIWAWVLIRFGVDRTQVDPPGLPLANGILEVKFKGRTATWELTPHSPNKLFTYLIDVEYNPEAKTDGVDTLLTCLDPPEREIFLRTLAASLDLNTFRAKTKHTIKALLLHGEGSNGKDSLRAVTSLLFSQSMVNSDFQDFKNYDQGNQNSLVSLINSKICWSSENSKFISLENCQSLKKAITGEPLTVKYLYENPQEINPGAVFLFNCNEPPSLSGGSEAIIRRWALLRFNKVFKKNADPRYNEIEADQRFRYDDEFLKTEVASGLLNKILERLPIVLKEGIDYQVVDENIKELQEESNHLWGFVKDLGIVEKPGAKLYIKDLWNDLREWYRQTDTIEVIHEGTDYEKEVFHDQLNPYDKTVKRSNQLYKAFKEMFPKIKKDSEKSNQSRKNQTYFLGLTKSTSLTSFPDTVGVLTSPLTSFKEVSKEAGMQSGREKEVKEVKCLETVPDEKLAIELIKRFSDFSPELQQNFTKELNELYNSLTSESKSEPRGEPVKVRFKGEIFAVKKTYSDQYVLTYPGQEKTVCMPQQDKCEVIEWG